MSDVQYYEYDIQVPLANLEQRLAESLAKPRTSATELAAFLLEAHLNVVSRSVANAAKTLSPAAERDRASWFNAQLKEASSDQDSWSDISSEAAIDTYLQNIRTANTINTTQLLGLTYYSLTRRHNAQVSEAVVAPALRLLGKFEAFGRLFSVYNKDFRKVSDQFDSLLNYALLSLVLLALHSEESKPEFLNTALKLNDLLVSVEGHVENEVETAATYAALSYGKTLVEALYASREFRLPADQ